MGEKNNDKDRPGEPLDMWEHRKEPLPDDELASLKLYLEAVHPDGGPIEPRFLLRAARRLWDEVRRARESIADIARAREDDEIGDRHELTRLTERVLRLEALYLDPAELAKEPAEALDRLRQMPGGAPLQLGRLANLEQAVEQTAAIGDGLTRIATVLERAAGVQERHITGEIMGTSWTPCPSCGCQLLHDRVQCPGCGADRSDDTAPSKRAAGIASLRRLGLNALADEEQRRLPPEPSPDGAESPMPDHPLAIAVELAIAAEQAFQSLIRGEVPSVMTAAVRPWLIKLRKHPNWQERLRSATSACGQQSSQPPEPNGTEQQLVADLAALVQALPRCEDCGGPTTRIGPDEGEQRLGDRRSLIVLITDLAAAVDQLVRQCDVDESEDLAWLEEAHPDWRAMLPVPTRGDDA